MDSGEHQTLRMLIALLAIGTVTILQAVACWLLMSCFKAIPASHRKQDPLLVWLLVIPMVALVWNFFVHPRLAESYRSYFDSRPDSDVSGDCGRKLGLAYSILFTLCVVPCVNFLALAAALVVLILFLVKALDLRRKVLDSAS